jgi:hypothetical protein
MDTKLVLYIESIQKYQWNRIEDTPEEFKSGLIEAINNNKLSNVSLYWNTFFPGIFMVTKKLRNHENN